MENIQHPYYPFGDQDEDDTVFEPFCAVEKWLFHVCRFRTPLEVVDEDKLIYSAHIKDVYIDNVGKTEDPKMYQNPAIKDVDALEELDILGDHAAYFTINNSPTVL